MSNHASDSHLQYRPDIDGLRAVAILLVVIYHAFPTVLPGGFVGVDVFFVISGYLISTIIFRSLRSGTFGFLDFYVRRIRRIFPALLVVLCTTYLFGWFSLFPDEFKRLGDQTLAGALFFQNFHLWHEAGYFVSLAESMPLLHLWSLSVEEQFYIAFPLVAWLAYRRHMNVVAVTVVLWAVSLGLCLFLSRNALHAVQAFYLPHTRIWEILTGSLLAIAQLNSQRQGQRPTSPGRPSFRAVASAIGIGLIFVAAITFNKYSPFPGWRAVLPVAGSLLLIAAGPSAYINRFALTFRPMVWFGVISYPLYLWHWPLLSYARILAAGTPTATIRIIAVGLSILLAWTTYRLIERPIRFAPRVASIPAALIGMVACIAIAGALTVRGNGLEFRAAAADAAGNRFDYPYKHSCDPLMGVKFGEDWCNLDSINIGHPRVVMIGDSFANAFSTIVRAHNESNGIPQTDFAQFGRGECPALLGYGPAYCQDLTQAAAKFITSTPSVENVILAANWPAYYSMKDYHGHGPNQTHQQFMDAFARTVEFYQRAGKHVSVFLATPQDTNPRSCVSRHFALSPPPEGGDCTYPLADALRGDSDYRTKVLPYLQSKDVPTFDPFLLMCGNSVCQIAVRGRVLYSDSGHISEFGGAYLASRGQESLSDLLSSPRSNQSITRGTEEPVGSLAR